VFRQLLKQSEVAQAWQGLIELLGAAPFRPRFGLALTDDQRRTYAQLDALNRWAGGSARLLIDPEKLFLALEFAAIVNPSLFHVAQVHYGVCLASIDLLGRRSPGLQSTINELDALRSVGVILITEAGRGNSHLAIETRAIYDPITDDFHLSTLAPSARKLMPSVGLDGVAKTGLVYAQIFSGGRNAGLFPFVVPIRDRHQIFPGIAISPLPGRSSLSMDYAEVAFTNVRVPRTHWLCDDTTLREDGTLVDPLGGGPRRLMRSLAVSSNASTAATVGAAACARAAVWIALRHTRQRRTVGSLSAERLVLEYRTHQGLLFGALAKACAITVTADEIVSSLRARGIGRDTTSPGSPMSAPWSRINQSAALAKAICVDGADQVLRDCRSASGAQGLLATNRFGDYGELVEAYATAGGNNRLILMDIGMELAAGGDYRSEPALVPGHLRSVQALRDLALASERRCYERVTRGLGAAQAAGHDAFAIWDPRLDAAIGLALAYGRRLVLESLLARAPVMGDDAPVADALAAIYAIHQFGNLLPDDVKDEALARAYDLVGRNLEALLEHPDLWRVLPALFP
jgi:acyl-CoA oxidase